MDERLQKVLARAGLGSRREIETWISAGRIKVNDRVAQLGDRVGPRDRIRIDGKPVRISHAPPRRRVLAYNKPEGEVCTRSDPGGRPTIFDALPTAGRGRWISIGRLDINTSGLILVTNDGELANRLMHPSTGIEREYAVRVHGEVDAAMLRALRRGVELEDGTAAFETISERGGTGTNRWFHVTLREGRKREVRRLWESRGVEVSRLMRVRYGNVKLPRGLRRGKWVELEASALDALLEQAGLAKTAEPAEERKPRRPPRKRRKRPGGRR